MLVSQFDNTILDLAFESTKVEGGSLIIAFTNYCRFLQLDIQSRSGSKRSRTPRSLSPTQSMVTLDPRMRFSVLHDVESLCFEHFGSAVSMQRDHVKFEAVVKAFNMSASYATSFGSGAREHIQNWWDQCRVTVEDRQPVIHNMSPAALCNLAQKHQLQPDVKAYAAVGQGHLLGIVLGGTNNSGEQLLFLKNLGAQMTLDNLILGESTKRQDKMLAGLNLSYIEQPAARSKAELKLCLLLHSLLRK